MSVQQEVKVKHLRSNQLGSDSKAKRPTPERIEVGEIAMNYLKGHETLFIKNSDGEVVDIINKNSDEFTRRISALETKLQEIETSGIGTTVDKDTKITRAYWTEDNTKLNIVLSDDTEVAATMVKAPEGQKYKVFYGNKITSSTTDFIAIGDITSDFNEFTSSNFTITFGEQQKNQFGYWGVAIDKRLFPSGITSVYMKSGGSFGLLTSGYKIEEVQHAGNAYWLIQDTVPEEIGLVSLSFE